MAQSFLDVIRWCAVPLVAVGALMATILFTESFFNLYAGINDHSGPLGRIILHGVVNYAAGLAAVMAGAYTAPSRRRITGLVIAICFLFVSGVIFFAALQKYGWMFTIDLTALSFGTFTTAARIPAERTGSL
jgi:hypothetical protein